jgi:hypothetical protein
VIIEPNQHTFTVVGGAKLRLLKWLRVRLGTVVCGTMAQGFLGICYGRLGSATTVELFGDRAAAALEDHEAPRPRKKL